MQNVSRETYQHTTKQIGLLGEQIAAQFLMKHGFTIRERNYSKKMGEIDIIAEKQSVIHFVEVKTVSYETRDALDHAVTHETWRPEEQVHHFKIHQIQKALETWISEHEYIGDWQIDVIGVRAVPRETFSTVNLIENIVF